MKPSNNKIMSSSGIRDGVIGEPDIPKPVQYRRVLYNYSTGASEMFFSEDDVRDALDSKEWVKSPALSEKSEYDKLPKECEYYINRKCTFWDGEKPGKKEEAEPSKPPDTPEPSIPTEEERAAIRDKFEADKIIRENPPPPTYKKYLGNMNLNELVIEGIKYNLTLDDKTMTRRDMRNKIKEAMGVPRV